MFLMDYVRRLVRSLVRSGLDRARHDKRRGLGQDVANLRFRQHAVRALLDNGIANYSWKVALWLRKVEETRNERLKYYTTGQVASLLGVSRHIVRKWLEAGLMTFVRRRVKARGLRSPALSYYYVPIAEVERYKKVLAEEREAARKVTSDGLGLTEAAAIIGVPRNTLATCYRRRKLRGTHVSEGRTKTPGCA
jgi:excisionase family DNA binding protein